MLRKLKVNINEIKDLLNVDAVMIMPYGIEITKGNKTIRVDYGYYNGNDKFRIQSLSDDEVVLHSEDNTFNVMKQKFIEYLQNIVDKEFKEV